MIGRIGYHGEGNPRNSAQADFLVNTLRANANDPHTYLVVAMHRPIADPKPHESFAVNGERVPLEKLFVKYGVDLVLNGHVHAYVRHDMSNGQPYMTIGTGGSPLYGPHSTTDTQPGIDRARLFYQYGFTMFRVRSDGTMTGTTYSLDPSTWSWHVSDRFSVPQQQPTSGRCLGHPRADGGRSAIIPPARWRRVRRTRERSRRRRGTGRGRGSAGAAAASR